MCCFPWLFCQEVEFLTLYEKNINPGRKTKIFYMSSVRCYTGYSVKFIIFGLYKCSIIHISSYSQCCFLNLKTPGLIQIAVELNKPKMVILRSLYVHLGEMATCIPNNHHSVYLVTESHLPIHRPFRSDHEINMRCKEV